MKAQIKLIAIGILLTGAASVHAEGVSLNDQKSLIREDLAITDLQNQYLNSRVSNLTLKITEKELENRLKILESQSGLSVDEIMDGVFNQNLSDEDRLSFGTDQFVGSYDPLAPSVAELNAKNSSATGGLNGMDSLKNMSPQVLEQVIKELIEAELGSKEKVKVTPAPVEKINLQDLFTDQNGKESNNVTFSEKAEIVLSNFNVESVVKSGALSKATISLDFEQKEGDKSDDYTTLKVDVVEGDIYTFYDKVYLIESISVNTVIIKNSTDKVDLVANL